MLRTISTFVGLAVGLAVLLAACQTVKPDPQALATARAFYNAVSAGRDDQVAALASPVLGSPVAHDQIARLRAFIPREPLRSASVVNAGIGKVGGGGATSAIDIEYDYGDRVALVSTHLSQPKGGGPWRIDGFHIQVATTAQLAVNRFGGPGKGPVQYGFLALAALSPLLMLGALVKVIFTPGLKWKWFWGALAFLGLFTVQMNWTTAQIAIQWASLQFIGFGVSSTLSRFAPWVVQTTFPLGALLILSGLGANPRVPRSGASTPTG